MNRKRNITPPAKCAVVVDNPPTAVLIVANGFGTGASAGRVTDDADGADSVVGCAMIIYL